MTEWKEYKLGEIADITPGFAFKSKDFGQAGELVVKIKDIAPPYIELANADHVDISSYDKNKLCKYLLSAGDYVVAMTGATIGKVGKLKTDKNAYLNQRVAKIKAKEGVCDDFVYFSICGDDFQAFIQNNIDSNSAQENISANSIGRFPVSLPPLNEQRRIAVILSSLDDKIDLLHRENATLEQMAETLFRQWLVEEAKEEWEEGKLGDLIDIGSGKGLQRSEFVENGLYSVLGANGDIGKTNKYLVDESNRVIYTGRVGTLGNVFRLENKKAWLSDNTLVIKPKEYYNFVYFVLKLSRLQDYNVGSTQPLIRQSDIKEIELVLPDRGILNAFEKECDLIYEKVENNNKQIQTLIQTRDGLLPKLMSNEIAL